MKILFKILSVFCLILIVSSCALFKGKMVNVKYIKPGNYNLGLKPNVNIIETKGSIKSYGEEFADYFVKKGKSKGFNFNNLTNQNIKCDINNNIITLTGLPDQTPNPNVYYFALEIVDKDDKEFKKEKIDKIKKDGKEIEVKSEIPYYYTEVVVQSTLTSTQNFILNQKEMKSSIEWEKSKAPNEKNERIIKVLQKIADNIIDDMTPTNQSNDIWLDNKDEKIQTIIDHYKENDNTPKAIEEFKAFLSSNPNSAAANFNIAVLLDLQKDYKGAIEFYNEALKLDPSNKDYKDALNGCQIRQTYLFDLTK